MITVIRRQLIENNVYKSLVWGMLMLMVLSLGLPTLVNQSSQKDSWIALVNDAPIAYEDYARKVADYEYKIRMFKRQFGDSFMTHFNPHTLALDLLVRNELVGQAARLLPLAIDAQALRNTLSDADFVYQELSDLVPPDAFDPSTGIKNDQLQRHLRALGISPSDFEHTVVDSMQRSVIKDLISLAAYTPATEVKEHYIHEYAGKKFSVIVVSCDDCMKAVKKKGVTQQELQSFFDNATRESNRYHSAEKRAGIVAMCRAKDYGITVSDAEIERYYNEHKMHKFIDKPTQVQVRHLVVKTAEQAEKIHDELVRNPSSFEKKVTEYSSDTKTVQSGGLLVPFSRNTTEEPVREKAAFLLKQDGDISDVIVTSDGFEILQRVSRVPATFISLAQAKKTISTELINAAFATRFKHDMEALAQKTETERGALDAYVIEHKGSVAEHPLTSNDGSMLMTQLFNLKQGQSTYYVEGDTATIVMLTRIEPSHIPPLSSVYATVEQDYYKKEARMQMQEIMKMIRAESATSSFAELGKRHTCMVITTPYLKKNDEKNLAVWRKKQLPIDYMLQIEKPEMIYTHEFEGNGYVVRLDEISPLDEKDFALCKKELVVKIERENREHVDAGFVASLYRHATIKQNESLITT